MRAVTHPRTVGYSSRVPDTRVSDITVMTKTFERPSCVRRLVASVRRFYPDVPMAVVDDSRQPTAIAGVRYIRAPFNIGVSAGKNAGIDAVDTPFVFYCDDDCVFDERTRLELLRDLIDAADLDLLAVTVDGMDFSGVFAIDGGSVTLSRGSRGERNGVVLHDFVPNMFLARTDALRRCRWDDRQKMADHFAFFFMHRGRLRVGMTAAVAMQHVQERPLRYWWHRRRHTFYVRQFMRTAGIEKRIDLTGRTIYASGWRPWRGISPR